MGWTVQAGGAFRNSPNRFEHTSAFLSWELVDSGGSRVMTVRACRTCGTELLDAARFCHGCRARGDAASYRRWRDCYRVKARVLGFEGQLALAEAMP